MNVPEIDISKLVPNIPERKKKDSEPKKTGGTTARALPLKTRIERSITRSGTALLTGGEMLRRQAERGGRPTKFGDVVFILGGSLVLNAREAAETLDELARENERIGKAFETFGKGTQYGALGLLAYQILTPVLAAADVIPPGAKEMVLLEFQADMIAAGLWSVPENVNGAEDS